MRLNRDMFREDDDLFAPIGQHPADHVHTPDAQPSAPDERVPLSIIDTYFDGDLRASESRSLFEKLRRRPDRAKEAIWTQRAIDALKKPVTSPDFSRAILRAVGDRRAWLPRKDRFAVWGLRYAAVFVLVGMTAAAFTLQRVAPEATALTPRVTPVANVVDAVSQSTEQAASTLPDSIANFHSSVLFSRSQLSLASYAQTNRAGQPSFSIATKPVDSTENTCVSAVGLRYTDNQTTVCDSTHDDENLAKRRGRMIVISTNKK